MINSILDYLGRTAPSLRKIVNLTCAALFLTHVHSGPDQEHLEPTKKPDWLKTGTELTPKIIPPLTASKLEFRDTYGGAKLFLAPLGRLEVDGVRVESAPEGERDALRASLNPARNRLIITRTTGSFYVSTKIGEKRVTADWDNRNPIPGTNYGNPPWFDIVWWVWLDDSTAISPGRIDTEDGYNTAQTGLFVFDINSKTMRRVNLKELDIRTHPELFITGVNPDKRMIRIILDDEDSSGNYRERTFFLKIPGE